MAKVIFKTFQEASAFSKNLAMTIKASTAIKRDGENWSVDDPRIADDLSQKISTTCVSEVQNRSDNKGYDADGLDSDGFYRSGFNQLGIHRDTGTAYDPAGFNVSGYDVEGYDIEGYDKDEYDREGKPKYPF